MGHEALESIHARGNVEIAGNRLGPRKGAAVLDRSADARLIVPLFNALSLSRGGIDMSFDPFVDIEPALEHLGIPIEAGRALIAKVE